VSSSTKLTAKYPSHSSESTLLSCESSSHQLCSWSSPAKRKQSNKHKHSKISQLSWMISYFQWHQLSLEWSRVSPKRWLGIVEPFLSVLKSATRFAVFQWAVHFWNNRFKDKLAWLNKMRLIIFQVLFCFYCYHNSTYILNFFLSFIPSKK